MRRGVHILVGALLVASAFAGCLGGDDGGTASDGTDQRSAEPSMDLEKRGTDSERAQFSVASVAGGLAYGDLVVAVDGDPYRFAADASFREATYTANGIDDPSTPVAAGNVLEVPAAGSVEVTFRDADTGAVWDRFDVTVPDEDAPSSPQLQSPQDGESGVSTTPTFVWAPVADPSGVTYSLEVSLDESFSEDVVVQRHDDITSSEFRMNQDQLVPGQTYYWHVRATDGEENAGAWSPTWSFTTEPR